MTVKNGIAEIEILFVGTSAPKIKSVILTITDEEIHNRRARMGIYGGFKYLIEGNQEGYSLSKLKYLCMVEDDPHGRS